MPLPGQLRRQVPRRGGRPAQRGLRVPALVRPDQRQQRRDQARVTVSQPLAARARGPHPPGALAAHQQLTSGTGHRRLLYPHPPPPHAPHPPPPPPPPAPPGECRRSPPPAPRPPTPAAAAARPAAAATG